VKRNLEDWISELAAAPPDRNLAGLEARVRQDIDHLRRQERAVRALAPARILALGVAVAIGAVAGGRMAVSALHPLPTGVFAAGSDLAPSTLLAGL